MPNKGRKFTGRGRAFATSAHKRTRALVDKLSKVVAEKRERRHGKVERLQTATQ